MGKNPSGQAMKYYAKMSGGGPFQDFLRVVF
jgi:hypothetical protein